MTEIDLDELSRRLGEVSVVDVRHPGEYDGTRGAACDPRQGHIPGAVLLDLDELVTMTGEELAARLGLDAGAEVIVYCHSGSRSALAAQVLGQHGYDARNYRGSWHEWSRTDLPLET